MFQGVEINIVDWFKCRYVFHLTKRKKKCVYIYILKVYVIRLVEYNLK